MTTATTARPRRGLTPRVVTVNLPPPAPLLRVWVAGKPISVNQLYGNRQYATGAKKRSKLLTPEARTWQDAVANSVMQWRFPESAPRPILAVSCVFVGLRADVDNLLKNTLDGLKIGLAVDDRYVMKVCAEKRPLERGGERGAWIEVTWLPQAQKPPRQPRVKRTA